jgi:hypothetical protein
MRRTTCIVVLIVLVVLSSSRPASASWESSTGLTGTAAPFRLVDQAQLRVGQIQALTGRHET